ncbi:DALR anticodon-binding domain-containing protein 3 [Zootermopsis nevadensis]|nr:DALR anticodon-binding domain-containing protein 3 [Zootermopsis nevadensis]
MKNIIENSKFWSLVVSKCSLQLDRVQIHLDRKLTFKCVLQRILSQKCMYGQFPAKHQRFVITSDNLQCDRDKWDLSEQRVDLLRTTIINLLEAMGYEHGDTRKSYEEEPTIFLHLSTKSSKILPGYKQILCGVVINSRHHSKESTVTAQEYLRQRCRNIKKMAMYKYGDIIQSELQKEDFLIHLGDAAVRIDLLHVKPSHTVCLRLDTEIDGSRETGSRGATFILYNCARIATILRQFEEKVQLGYYPHLISYEEVDFSLLSKDEEWDLLFLYLLSYPSVLQNSVQNVEHGKLSPHLVCSFIMAMCSCFSVYYRRVHILTDSRTHLLPVMFARLYLLRGIQQVLHNALNLLGILPVVHM